MIEYGTRVGRPEWQWLFQLHGSVFPKCFRVILPISLLAVGLKVLDNRIGTDVTSMQLLQDNTPWNGFTSLVVFVLVFRLSQAYTKYWDAYTTTNSMMQDWIEAASSMAAFCLDGNVDDSDMDESRRMFLHTGIRLFSMLSACALQELSPRESHKIWGLLTLDSDAIDAYSLATLDGSTRRVDLCYHWLQQLLIQGHKKGLLDSPPPIVNRTFTELSSGMSKFADAKKTCALSVQLSIRSNDEVGCHIVFCPHALHDGSVVQTGSRSFHVHFHSAVFCLVANLHH